MQVCLIYLGSPQHATQFHSQYFDFVHSASYLAHPQVHYFSMSWPWQWTGAPAAPKGMAFHSNVPMEDQRLVIVLLIQYGAGALWHCVALQSRYSRRGSLAQGEGAIFLCFATEHGDANVTAALPIIPNLSILVTSSTSRVATCAPAYTLMLK